MKRETLFIILSIVVGIILAVVSLLILKPSDTGMKVLCVLGSITASLVLVASISSFFPPKKDQED